MSDKVDKQWQQKGLDGYSTQALLNTLAHYGVVTTEAEFLERAKNEYPLTIAADWHQTWKGTGQFSRFPAAASEQLWTRLQPGELAPVVVTLALIKLMDSLAASLDGKADDGTQDTRFKVVEAFLLKLPTEPKRRDVFVGEVVAAMSDYFDVFDHMAVALASKKQLELAQRWVAIEEALLPDRLGVVSARVADELGDSDGAIATLVALATAENQSPAAKCNAIDALIDLDAYDQAEAALIPLCDLVAESGDLDDMEDVVTLVQGFLEHSDGKNPRALHERVEKLISTLEDQDD